MPLYSTSLDPMSGVDPQWDIVKPTFDIRIANAQAEARRRRDESQNQYNQSIYDLGNRVLETRRSALSGLEGRGVLNSGETQTRMSEIAAQDAEARRRATESLTGAQSGADTWLTSQLDQTAVDREMAVQAALDRQRQNAINAWNAAQAQNAQNTQNALLQQIANRPLAAPATRTVYAPAPRQAAAPAGPSAADIARWNAAVAANQARAALPTGAVQGRRVS